MHVHDECVYICKFLCVHVCVTCVQYMCGCLCVCMVTVCVCAFVGVHVCACECSVHFASMYIYACLHYIFFISLIAVRMNLIP